MAILFLDGCDHLSTQNVVTKYDQLETYTSGDVTVVTSVTRLGTTGAVYKFPNAFTRRTVMGINCSALGAQSYLGLGINIMPSFITATASAPVLLIRDTASASVVRLAYSNQRWVLTVGSADTFAASTASNILAASTWLLAELAVSYGASGTVLFYANGSAVLSYSGSVLTSAATGMTRAYWGTVTVNASPHLDDFYVINNAAPQVSTMPIGLNMRIRTHWPNDDTATSAWTPDTGSTHFTQVDESSTPGGGHDGAATYVCTTSANARDLYNIESATGTYSANEIPLGVQVVGVARATAGSPSLNLLAELSGTIVSHTTTCAVSSDWYCHRAVFTSAPGGVSWVVSRIDAVTIGQEMA